MTQPDPQPDGPAPVGPAPVGPAPVGKDTDVEIESAAEQFLAALARDWDSPLSALRAHLDEDKD